MSRIIGAILICIGLIGLCIGFAKLNTRVVKLEKRIEKLEKFSVLKFQLCDDKDETKCEKYRAFDLQYDEPTEEGIMTYRIRYINEKHLEQFLDTIRRYLVELEEEQKRKVDEQWEHDTQQQETVRETRAE